MIAASQMLALLLSGLQTQRPSSLWEASSPEVLLIWESIIVRLKIWRVVKFYAIDWETLSLAFHPRSVIYTIHKLLHPEQHLSIVWLLNLYLLP